MREEEDRTVVLPGQTQSGPDILSPPDLIKPPVGSGGLEFLNAVFDPIEIASRCGAGWGRTFGEACSDERD